MNQHDMLLARQTRILDTMAGKKTDRPPLWFSGDTAMMRYNDPEVSFESMVVDHERLTRKIVTDFLPEFPKIDMLMAVGMSSRNMGAGQMAKTLLPGKELPADEMFQLVFPGIITDEDYDRILKGGSWAKFNEECMFQRLGYDPESLKEDGEAGFRNKTFIREAGFPFVLYGGPLPETFDLLAFGRTIMNFYVDVYESPDEVHAVLDMMLDEFEEQFTPVITHAVEEAAKTGEKAMFSVQPGVQANANLVGRDVFEEFAWPSYKRQADLVLKCGGMVHFHMDSNWTPFLDSFQDFPKGRCIFDGDGFTDLFKTRDMLGGTMAFTGSIPPHTMAFGTPDEVYNCLKEQIACMGDSFIAAPSCSLPSNMPAENIRAMYAAIDEL